jgi:hypothetical protein
MKTNAIGIENVQNWLNEPKFDHTKYIVIGAKVMITNILIFPKVL